MKLNKLVYLLVVALAFTGGVTGCKKKPVKPTPLPNPTGTGMTGEPTPGGTLDPNAEGGVPMNPDLANLDNYNQDRATLAAHTVHFAYDSAAIRSSETAHVEAVASHLKTSGAALLIEGHCDERGTAEYNMALGAKRAQAAMDYLTTLGIAANRLSTISYGEEIPVCKEKTEQCWARNRRARFVVSQSKPTS